MIVILNEPLSMDKMIYEMNHILQVADMKLIEGTILAVVNALLANTWRSLIRIDLEIHETRNMSDKNQRFGASCVVVKVT